MLWGPPNREDVKKIAERLKFVTPHVVDRVEAELGHLDHVDFLDVPAIKEAYACTDEEEGRGLRQAPHSTKGNRAHQS